MGTIECCLFASVSITFGWLVQGRGGFPVGNSLDSNPIPALPCFPFVAGGPGRVRLPSLLEDPPPLCPSQKHSFHSNKADDISSKPLPEQIPAGNFRRFDPGLVSFLLFCLSFDRSPLIWWPPVVSWAKEGVFCASCAAAVPWLLAQTLLLRWKP